MNYLTGRAQGRASALTGNALVKMLAQRLALGVLTLFAVSLVIFFCIELLPGDFAKAFLGHDATPEAVAALRLELGLDRPAPIRYLDWLGGFISGDMGRSLANDRPIVELILPRLAKTLFLAAYSAVIAVPLAVGLGLLSALYRKGLFDTLINVVALVAISLPEFFVGYLLIFVFSIQLNIFPSLSIVSDSGSGLSDLLMRTTLPAIALTFGAVAHMMRMTRAAIVNLLASPYVETARLKGVPKWRVIVRHAFPNALAPIINVVALNLAYLIVGVVVVESVFVYPGLGDLLVDSVSKRDLPVVQACSMIFAAVYVALNLTADILSVLTNPRLLHPK